MKEWKIVDLVQIGDLVLFLYIVVIVFAMVLAEGCEAREIGGDEPVCPELYCECEDREDCFGYGGVADPIRGTCGPSDVCTIACETDDDCGDGTCGPDDVAGVIVCTEVHP